MKLSLGSVCILIAAALLGFAVAQTGYQGQPGTKRTTFLTSFMNVLTDTSTTLQKRVYVVSKYVFYAVY